MARYAAVAEPPGPAPTTMTSAVAVTVSATEPARPISPSATASMAPIIPFVRVLVKMFTNSAPLYARPARRVC